jgi:predicted amidohydrolase
MSLITVSAIQLGSQEGRSLEQAFGAASEAVGEAAAAGADLVVLPEIWTPGYFAFDHYADAADDAESIRRRLADLARHHGIHLHGGSFVERRHDNLYNTSVLFGPDGSALAEYSKIHLFGYGSREPEVLTPGDSPTVVVTDLGRVGLAVCYDLRFPELFREMTDRGAELLLVASAWPHPRVEAWSTLAAARATENQVFLVAANGVGPTLSGPSLCGHSVIHDPWGVPVARAGDEPAVITATIDPAAVADARGRLRQLADRRLLAPGNPRLAFRRPGERPLVMNVRRVDIAGYTGRDRAAVERYVAKLEEEGIAPPASIPSLFRVGADRVVAHDTIDVTGTETCGEVEFVLLVTDQGIHVTVGSDHTDRALEQTSIPLAKQAVPKVVAGEAWRLEELEDHWDGLRLEAWVGQDRRPYQKTGVDFFLPPRDILDLVPGGHGTVIYGGTVSSIGGGFDFDPVFTGRLTDPVLDRHIEFTYRARPLEEP